MNSIFINTYLYSQTVIECCNNMSIGAGMFAHVHTERHLCVIVSCLRIIKENSPLKYCGVII